jgi:hypothetical protein
MTVDDYFNTPETVKPMELAFGVLRAADAPTPRHQSAVAHLFVALNTHVRERQCPNFQDLSMTSSRICSRPMPTLLVPQRRDRVQPRRAPGRWQLTSSPEPSLPIVYR